VIGAAVRAAKNGAQPQTYTGASRIPAVVALFLALVLIASTKNKHLPDQRHAIALGVGAIVVAGAAAVFPRFIFWILLATVVIVALNNSDVIAEYIDRGHARLKESLVSA